ncbi:MAG TPA: AAA family ATPase [Chloroflexia bacterium]|nr:AAA family ATPase [Chloroflexia bacterium]
MDTTPGRQPPFTGGVAFGDDAHVSGPVIGGNVGSLTVQNYSTSASVRLAYATVAAHLVSYYTRVFANRRQEWATLADWVSEAAPGYLLVTAQPGYGKSALVAQALTRLHESAGGQRPGCIYFFVRQANQQHTPGAFLQAVNSQLLDLLGDSDTVPPELEAQQSQFTRLWTRALTAALPTAPLVLLVDGLDEMAPGPVTIASLLPGALRPFTHVLISSRLQPDAREQVALEHPLRRARALVLGALTAADVSDMLQQEGMDAAAAGPLADRVWAVTRGEPLYTRAVTQQVAHKAGALADLEREPPADVDAYFKEQLRQLEVQAGDADVVWQVLGLLVAAHGGITASEIADALELSPRAVTRVLGPLARFLIGGPRLELMHQRFRAVLAAQFSARELAAQRDTYLAWGARYGIAHWPVATPEYLLLHLPAHLREAAAWGDLYSVVLDPAFRRAQVQSLREIAPTLGALRAAMDSAWQQATISTAMACVGAYRETLTEYGTAAMVFAALESGDVAGALRQAARAAARPDWGAVLHAYLGWEARVRGEPGLADEARAAAASLPIALAADLIAALHAPSAPAVTDPSGLDVHLATIAAMIQDRQGPQAESGAEFRGMAAPSAEPPTWTRADPYWLMAEVGARSIPRAEGAAEAEAEAASPSRRQNRAEYLRDLLLQVVSVPAGQRALDSLIALESSNPYPHYRDLMLVALGVPAAAIPDPALARPRLQAILRAALDQEGISFTFDLPSVLMAEAAKRRLNLSAVPDVTPYLDQALAQEDLWGTRVRAKSAAMGALFRTGRPAPFPLGLRTIAAEMEGYAGYTTLMWLTLGNRCFEFGHPAALAELWPVAGGPARPLLDAAAEQADRVLEPQLRESRQRLVSAYREWVQLPDPPDTAAGLAAVQQVGDPDLQLAYVDHLSARWSNPAVANVTGLEALVPFALADPTTLDALLGRVAGLRLPQLTDDELGALLEVCQSDFCKGRPWDHGNWR